VLGRLHKYNLKLKPQKCKLIQREVAFLGRKITREGIRVTEENIKLWRNGQYPDVART
jgi:hypothetical protein